MTNQTPPEPSTTAEELAQAQATAYAETNRSKDCPRCGDLFYHPKTLIEDQRQRAKEWEDVAKAKDAEISALKALLHDEAKDYAETIMKLCEECGVESIQDIGPKLAELKAEHDRLQEDLCEKVVSEGGKLEATLAALQKQNEGLREALQSIASGNDRVEDRQNVWPKWSRVDMLTIAEQALAAADEMGSGNG